MLKKVVMLALLIAPMAFGNVTFSDDFESGLLTQWTGQNGGTHNGIIVADPTVVTHVNQVLSFSATKAGGDVFTSALISYQNGPITLSFDYLGLSAAGAPVADSGGFVGFAYGLAGTHSWIAATQENYNGIKVHLIDDGAWHSYAFTINPTQDFRVMIEDFVGPARNAYFDNIKVTNAVVPAPGALLLSSLGTGLVGWLRRRK